MLGCHEPFNLRGMGEKVNIYFFKKINNYYYYDS